MRVALAQINPIVGDLKGNQQKILDFVERAKKVQADIVVFPELAICGYPPEDLLHKDHFIQDNIKTLRSLTKKITKIAAVIGFVDVDQKKNQYNAAGIIIDGRLKGVYRKEELPNYGVFDEKRYFSAGSVNKSYSLNGTSFGVNICEDIWVNKGTYKQQAKKGVRLLINISSSPFDLQKLQAREKLLTLRAKETNAFVCYVNLVGGQDELVFDGGSLIIDPKGNIIASGKQFEEDLIMADIDIKKKEKGKRKTLIKTNKHKPLSQIEQIYKALVLGTHDYIRKNNFQKVVLGLSGGIDSAFVSAIAVDAIGKNNVIAITLPSRYTSKGTNADAKALSKNLGIKLIEIPIETIFESYLQSLSKEFKGLKEDMTEENIQARIRGNLIMALSNKFGWLVLTTGNKSEIAVGYCTLYGDMSGGFAVIKDVPKSLVYELAKFRNKNKGGIPDSILKRAPSAELRENQKDQDSLPDYNTLDALLKDYVQEHKSFKVISRGNDQNVVKNVITLVDRNEYKRRQSPPGIKITPRAFGKDWRLPITNKYKEF